MSNDNSNLKPNEDGKLPDMDLLTATVSLIAMILMPKVPQRILMMATILLTRFYEDEKHAEFAEVKAIEKSLRKKDN